MWGEEDHLSLVGRDLELRTDRELRWWLGYCSASSLQL